MLGRKPRSKGKSSWTGTSSFVLEVPLCNLRHSIIYSVPCDGILRRAYYLYSFDIITVFERVFKDWTCNKEYVNNK